MPRKRNPKSVENLGIPLVLGDPNASNEAPATAAKEPWEEKLESLSKSFEAREKAHSDQIDRLFGLLTSAASAPAPAAHTANTTAFQAQTPVLDLSGLPDPVSDAAAYNRGLQERVQKFAADTMAHSTAQAQAVASTQNQQGAMQKKLDALWDKFQGTYKDLDGMEDFVQLSAKSVIQETVDLGGDANRLIFSDPDRFLAKVAERTRSRLNEIGWKPKGEEDGEEADDGEADESRTALVTGQPATFRGPATAANPNPRLNGLLAELSTWQRNAKIV